ncbi:MAG: sigma-70 family RNA polymerase sigma factor [Planctomycetota bacterium]|jgi:RNA polymerase sigma-70 factor (ECF subfamily)
MGQDAEPSDEQLAESARKGDERAFQLLFERHAPALRQRVARQLPGLLRRKVAESDVIQMTYLRVHQSLETFRGRMKGSFRAWLGQIVENQVADLIRRYIHTAKRRLDHEVSGPQPLSGGQMPGPQPTPSLVAAGEELRQRLQEAMETLPDDYRAVLRLVQGEGLTLAESGERLGRTAGAAKQLYARAVARLSEVLDQDEDPGGG